MQRQRSQSLVFEDFLAETAELLAVGWGARGRRRTLLAVATRHVVDFQTWRSLTADSRIAQSDVIELATGLVEVAAGSRSRSNP